MKKIGTLYTSYYANYNKGIGLKIPVLYRILDKRRGLFMNIKAMKYTWEHKKAFIKVEKELLGYNTLRGYLHDTDKLLLYIFLPKKLASNIHRACSKHHQRAKTVKDNIQKLIDWECARLTKLDKPLTARETLYKLYPELISELEPILKALGL